MMRAQKHDTNRRIDSEQREIELDRDQRRAPQRRFRMRMRTCETMEAASSPEAHDVVQDVTDQKAPPDDEGKDQGQGGGVREGSSVRCCRQQTQ
jgi:hypothetical protein